MNERIKDALDIAIKRIRDCCDSAERSAKEGNLSAISDVMHEFAWGFANASSRVEAAISRVQSEHAAELYALQKEKDELMGVLVALFDSLDPDIPGSPGSPMELARAAIAKTQGGSNG